MKTKTNYLKLLAWAGVIAVILIAGRLGDHTANFTPTIAIALVAGYVFRNKGFAILSILAAMLISDFIIGMDSLIMRALVYGSLLLSVILGGFLPQSQATKNGLKSQSGFALKTAGAGLIGAVAFFIITNAGVWASSSMYTLDMSGLLSCYINAIPFFQKSLVATMGYAALFFGAIRMMEMLAKEKKLQAIAIRSK